MAESLENQIVKLRLKKKSYKEIASILQCSIAVISYHCQKNNLTQIGLSKKIDITDLLKKEIAEYYLKNSLEETAAKFNVSVSTVKKYAGRKRKELNEGERKSRAVKAVQKRRRKIKELAVEYKGGKCERCGYNKYIGALEFHHLDPHKKDFSLSHKGHCRSWEAVKKELDKCVLVCANCHREIHGNLK